MCLVRVLETPLYAVALYMGRMVENGSYILTNIHIVLDNRRAPYTVKDSAFMQIGDITSHSLLLQGSTAFFKVVALNVAFWLAFMLAR